MHARLLDGHLAILLHQLSKVGVDSSLIPLARCLYPRHYIRIQADGHGGFLRPIKPSNYGIRGDLANFRSVRPVDFTIGPSSEFPKLLSLLRG
jgi:hypothetical protein